MFTAARNAMPAGQLDGVIRLLRKAALRGEGAELNDAQLLERFSARRDEAAFEVLVRRHGPTPEQIRQLRAVMLLELIGDSASKNLLKRWAGGRAGALLTLEAAAALKRLETVAKASR
jgi:hypothetical protein